MGCTSSKALETRGVAEVPPGGVGVEVVYCGAWHSFGRKYKELVSEATKRYPDSSIVFSGKPTPKRTGWFEVTVDGTLVFSTKAGMGRFNSPDKMERVLKAIGKALEAKKGEIRQGPVKSVTESGDSGATVERIQE